jgi:hypothetical protein
MERALTVILTLALFGGLIQAQEGQDPCSPEDLGGIRCGAMFLRVEARAVHLDQSGHQQPVRGVRVFSGYYVDGEFSGALRRVKAKVKKSGEFSFMGNVPRSVRTVCEDGEWQEDEILLTSHYLLRAKGCEDLTIEVTRDWSPRSLTMKCKAG